MKPLKTTEKQNIQDILALTPMQEGMLFHYLKDPQSQYYFVQLNLGIKGEIDIQVFKEAWNLVIKTNDMLRTVLRWEKMDFYITRLTVLIQVVSCHNFSMSL